MSDDSPGGFRLQAFHARIRWLLLARVLIVTVFLGATALTHVQPDSDPDFPLREVATLIVAAYLFSLGSATFLQHIRRLRAFAYLQVSADVFLISLAVPLTGGLRSPMAVWYNLAIIAAAILLFRRGAFVTAALSSVTYGILMNLIYYEALPVALVYSPKAIGPGFAVVYQIAANIGSFFSIAFLSSILVERLARTEWALEQSEATLQRISALQRTLVQNLESGILTTDSHGRIESANQAVETILGRRAADVIGKRIVEIFPVLRPPLGKRHVLGPNPVPTELSYSAGPGTEARILRCISAALADTYDNPIGMLFILQDITTITEMMEERDEQDAERGSDAAVLGEPGPPALEG
ncbi:MAG: PAS domain-containing protein, partial [Candidatus Binatia bacterium]